MFARPSLGIVWLGRKKFKNDWIALVIITFSALRRFQQLIVVAPYRHPDPRARRSRTVRRRGYRTPTISYPVQRLLSRRFSHTSSFGIAAPIFERSSWLGTQSS